MTTDKDQKAKTISTSERNIPAAAQRALQEAEERRVASEQAQKDGPTEKGGPKGKEPTRYGDWERQGRAVDF